VVVSGTESDLAKRGTVGWGVPGLIAADLVAHPGAVIVVGQEELELVGAVQLAARIQDHLQRARARDVHLSHLASVRQGLYNLSGAF
jgi:hypothetical protein